MKKFSIIAMVLAFTMMLSVVSFAAPAFKLAEGAEIPEGTTVTPAADSIAVSTTATAGNYYGVLLVEGNALPTVDNAILYINQATAADVAQAFDVLPNMAALEDGDVLTLYISSNVAGASLIAIPMLYADEEIVPDIPVDDILLGDVDGDGAITSWDGYYMTLFELGDMGIELINEDIAAGYCQKFWDENDDSYAVARGDVDGDGAVTSWDGYYVTLYELGEMGIEIIMEDIELGYCQKFWKD